MLVHIVVWKYKDEVREETRNEHRDQLKNLTKVILNIESFLVGRDILHLERSYNTGLTSMFADRDALAFYTEHEAHQEVAAFGKKISEHVASVDFVIGQDIDLDYLPPV